MDTAAHTQSIAAPVPHGAETDVESPFLYGLIAEFDDPEPLVQASQAAYEAGYRRMDAYTPLPVEGLPAKLGFKDMAVPWIMLASGILGGLGGFGLLYFCMVIDYRLNVGGRPVEPGHFGWVHFMPITFECTVLLAALMGIGSMFVLNGLPQPYHPVFDAPDFDKATSSRFFLCIEAEDPKFDLDETRAFLEGLRPSRVSIVPLRK